MPARWTRNPCAGAWATSAGGRRRRTPPATPWKPVLPLRAHFAQTPRSRGSARAFSALRVGTPGRSGANCRTQCPSGSRPVTQRGHLVEDYVEGKWKIKVLEFIKY